MCKFRGTGRYHGERKGDMAVAVRQSVRPGETSSKTLKRRLSVVNTELKKLLNLDFGIYTDATIQRPRRKVPNESVNNSGKRARKVVL